MADQAWTVTEIDRGWPTQVDAVAIDPHSMQIIDRTRFADFPLMAKLTRWGVDFHMGILFGLANQLVLIAFGIALCVLIVWGIECGGCDARRSRQATLYSPFVSAGWRCQ